MTTSDARVKSAQPTPKGTKAPAGESRSMAIGARMEPSAHPRRETPSWTAKTRASSRSSDVRWSSVRPATVSRAPPMPHSTMASIAGRSSVTRATAARLSPCSTPPMPTTGVSRRRTATDPAMTEPTRPPMPMAPMMSPAPASPAPSTSVEKAMPRMSRAPPITNRVAMTSSSARAPHSPHSAPRLVTAVSQLGADPSSGGGGATSPSPRQSRVATAARSVAMRNTNHVPTSCVPTPATIGPMK